MIRITELRLPLDHPPAALKTAAAQRLGVPEHALATLHVHKRSHDARKKQALTFIYSVDLELEGGADAEARLLARFADDPRVTQAPDMAYHFVARAPATLAERPVFPAPAAPETAVRKAPHAD